MTALPVELHKALTDLGIRVKPKGDAVRLEPGPHYRGALNFGELCGDASLAAPMKIQGRNVEQPYCLATVEQVSHAYTRLQAKHSPKRATKPTPSELPEGQGMQGTHLTLEMVKDAFEILGVKEVKLRDFRSRIRLMAEEDARAALVSLGEIRGNAPLDIQCRIEAQGELECYCYDIAPARLAEALSRMAMKKDLLAGRAPGAEGSCLAQLTELNGPHQQRCR